MIAVTVLFTAYLLRFVSRSGKLFAFCLFFASDFMLWNESNYIFFSWSILTFDVMVSLGLPVVEQPGNKDFDSCELLRQE